MTLKFWVYHLEEAIFGIKTTCNIIMIADGGHDDDTAIVARIEVNKRNWTCNQETICSCEIEDSSGIRIDTIKNVLFWAIYLRITNLWQIFFTWQWTNTHSMTTLALLNYMFNEFHPERLNYRSYIIEWARMRINTPNHQFLFLE